MDEIEIPEVITEEEVELTQKSTTPLFMPVMGIILFLGIGGVLSMFFLSAKPKSAPPAVKQLLTKSVTPKQPTINSTVTDSPVEPIPTPKSSASTTPRDLLGHLPYQVAPQSALEAITADGNLKLRSAAAHKFKQMQADARAEGVILVPISAFRTTEVQEQLFFGIKEQRVQNAAKRAEVSAPPGYSEHHTGYAIDIGDGNAPATNLETTFADTTAFAWLEQNALKYSFELSFPPNNEQGVNYEPWHWRFVGDRNSLETFYQGKK